MPWERKPRIACLAALELGCPNPDTVPAAAPLEQKPDLQYDGLRGYAARAGLDIVRDYCDVWTF